MVETQKVFLIVIAYFNAVLLFGYVGLGTWMVWAGTGGWFQNGVWFIVHGMWAAICLKHAHATKIDNEHTSMAFTIIYFVISVLVAIGSIMILFQIFLAPYPAPYGAWEMWLTFSYALAFLVTLILWNLVWMWYVRSKGMSSTYVPANAYEAVKPMPPAAVYPMSYGQTMY